MKQGSQINEISIFNEKGVTNMKWLKVFCQVLLIDIALLGLTAPAQAAEVDLRVLVVSVGNASTDSGLAVIQNLLNSVGVPYEVLDTNTENLTLAKLQTGSRGRFNGIILTNAETAVNNGGLITQFVEDGIHGFSLAEFQLLHDYELGFGVREAVMGGWPSTDATVGIDYGMSAVVGSTLTSGLWQSPAGGTEIFEYINTNNQLPILDANGNGVWTDSFLPRDTSNDNVFSSIEPLLVDPANPTYGMIFRLNYKDGRKALLCTLYNATWLTYSNLLSYEFLNFATSGLFIGARHVYLAVHSDDMFLPDEEWNTATQSNYDENVRNYRVSASEIVNVAAAQTALRAAHPTASGFKIDIAFNGIGTSSTDPLTTAVRLLSANFGFINHSYSAVSMDRVCSETQPGVGNPTPYATIYKEISKNVTVWKNMRFTGYQYATSEFLADAHSGLNDRHCTDNQGDDTPFPTGFNSALGQAASALGVRLILADHSQPNQDTIQQIPGYNIAILPRYPTNLYYNTTTPDEVLSEYNWIYYYQWVNQGLPPTQHGGIAAPLTSYSQIIDYESAATLTQMLTYYPYPHYFHQSNLHTYATGRILQFDWLDAVLTAYERLIKLPIVNPRVHDLDTLVWQILTAKQAAPTGFLNTATGVVTLSASKTATVEVTGLAGGNLYGGQRILKTTLSTTTKNFTIDPALSQ
jgi:hypothetical protein